MSATLQLKPDAERFSLGTNNSFELHGIVFGATGFADAVSAALLNTSLFPLVYTATLDIGYGSFPFSYMRGNITANPIVDKQSAGGSQPGTWEVDCHYDAIGYSNQPRQIGDTVRTFEIGRDMVNRKTSLPGTGTLGVDAGHYPSTAPELNGLVNIDKDDQVLGTDVPVPTFKWTETYYMADSTVTDALVEAWYAVAQNPVANGTFRTFAAYESLFVGVSGTLRHRGGDWELNFSFAASPNVTGLQVGPVTGISKRGWQYLWARSPLTAVTASDSKVYWVPIPAHVYVDNVIGTTGDGTSDFSTLGI